MPIMPNVTHGGDTSGLVRYLVGPGTANEHTDPMFIAGCSDLAKYQPGDSLSHADVRLLADVLDLSMVVNDRYPMKKITTPRGLFDKELHADKANHVWHCSLSLPAEQGNLDTDMWHDIARSFLKRMDFIDPEDPSRDCQWVAVSHGLSKNGNAHIHLVVNRVRANGTVATLHNDFKRAQSAANGLEKEFSLGVLESREHGRGSRAYQKPDLMRARAAGRNEVDSHKLQQMIHTSVNMSHSEAEFVYRLRASGVWVRPRYAKDTLRRVSGYAVALPPPAGQRPVWYAAGKLDRDLSLVRIRDRFGKTTDAQKAQASEAWNTRSASAARARLGELKPIQYADVSRALQHMKEIEQGCLLDLSSRDMMGNLAREITGTMNGYATRFANPEAAAIARNTGKISQTHFAFRPLDVMYLAHTARVLARTPDGQVGYVTAAVVGVAVLQMSAALIKMLKAQQQLATAKQLEIGLQEATAILTRDMGKQVGMDAKAIRACYESLLAGENPDIALSENMENVKQMLAELHDPMLRIRQGNGRLVSSAKSGTLEIPGHREGFTEPRTNQGKEL